MNSGPREMTRRVFLSSVAAFSSALSAPVIIPASARGANGAVAPSEKITVALIGRGMMGRGHWQVLLGNKQVQVLGICDVDRLRREEGRIQADETYAAARAAGSYRGCVGYNDYRELLARPDLDAVVIATPDHWHTPLSMAAARAGKDVYCEKPVSLTLEEGRKLVRTIQGYGRIFQTGTQYRSMPAIRQVCNFVRNGGIGRVKAVFGQWGSIGGLREPRFAPYTANIDISKYAASRVPVVLPLPSVPVPEGLDWPLWVGPAAWHDYNPVYHINPMPGVVPWAFCEDFGAASVTWFHSHTADVCQYGIGMETTGPVEIIHPSSNRFPTLTCRYENGVLFHHVDHWGQVKSLYGAVPDNAKLEGSFGGVFVGERGWITSMYGGGDVQAGPENLLDEMKLKGRDPAAGGNTHHGNWFECIRTRAKPSSYEEIGHRSASLGHLVTLCFKLGRSLKWNPVREEFEGDEEANRLRSRAAREPWRV